MVFSRLVATLVVSAALQTTYAAPGLFTEVGASSFKVHREATGNKKLRSGPAAVQKAFSKFNGTVPEHIRLASSSFAAQSGSVAAAPEIYDAEYLSPVHIGTPAKTVYLDFDTGSSDLWVFTGQLPNQEWMGHKNYFPRNSTTAKRMKGESWTITYGDGSGASGNVWADKVCVGSVTATSQAVEAATSVSTSFLTDKSLSGLLGLGSSANNQITPTKQTTFFDTVKSSLASPLFAAALKAGTPGSYDFGFINGDHYTGQIHYAPATLAAGYWEMTTTGYAIGSTVSQSTFTSIVDTGTSLLFVSEDMVDAYYAQIENARNSVTAGGWIFPCAASPPSFSIIVDGSMRTVPGKFLNFAPSTTVLGSAFCFGGLQVSTGLPFNILGDVFIKSQYVVFDAGNSRLGFADPS